MKLKKNSLMANIRKNIYFNVIYNIVFKVHEVYISHNF